MAIFENGFLKPMTLADAGLAPESTMSDDGQVARAGYAVLVSIVSLAWAPYYIGLGYVALAALWEFLARPALLSFIVARTQSDTSARARSLQAGMFISAMIYGLLPLQGVLSGDVVGWFLLIITFCSSVVCSVIYFVNDRDSLLATIGPITLISMAAPFMLGLEWDGILAVMALNALYISAALTAAKYYQSLVTQVDTAADARDKAESSNLAKSQFLATMSHELRTPLNAIIGYSEMMKETALDDKRAADCEDHDKVIRAAHSLLTLINDLLDISKIEAGKMQLNIEPFCVKELISQAACTADPLAQRNGNSLDVFAAPDLGEAVSDSFRVNQCLLNLLSNAAKFTSGGALRLSARRECERNADWLIFEITDTGIGMTEAQLKLLFQPFVQADSNITRSYGGTGLGLAITRRIANMLGGEITAKSELGKGSVFTLRLPAVFDATPDTDTTHDDLDNTSGQAVALVIDDDVHTRDLVRRNLGGVGFSVIATGRGADGAKLARKHTPAIILLDINLPDCSGWDMIKELRGDAALTDTPILVVSIEDDRQRALALGACDLLTKPVSKAKFVATVLRYARSANAPAQDTTEKLARALY